ncbi:25949_t:CDS:2 [Gigaspora margarita]|uniref:25949_t:CDS:1 n=1 Tax=Gigaspora margarita TaxID=4874 RepID=A0ABN7W1E1_GIGMA|nr:25949_t:CDS:2 [Gigaspora margarita]
MLCSNCYKKIPEGEEVTKSGKNYFRASWHSGYEFSDGYEKSIRVAHLPRNINKEYIEIDIDETKIKSKNHIFYFGLYGVSEVVKERKRDEMIKLSSADPTTLAITREGMDRVDQGNQTEFKQENGKKRIYTIYSPELKQKLREIIFPCEVPSEVRAQYKGKNSHGDCILYQPGKGDLPDQLTLINKEVALDQQELEEERKEREEKKE